MKVTVRQGDVLDEQVDVLLCTANPMLRMSGGVNGALLLRGGESVRDELDHYLSELKKSHVEPGTVVRTGPGPLAVQHILHVVGVNMFYESSVDLVRGLLVSALTESSRLGGRTVATPALGTGYGPLSIAQFAEALVGAIPKAPGGLDQLVVVLRNSEDVQRVREVLQGAGIQSRDS